MDFQQLLRMQQELMDKVPHGHKIKDEHQGIVVAALGVIEETLEYLNTIGIKSWRPNPLPKGDQLEELVDIGFFFLELIIFSGFTWEDFVNQYKRKHAENLQRYEKAMIGDFSWDKRAEKKEL